MGTIRYANEMRVNHHPRRKDLGKGMVEKGAGRKEL